MSGLGSPDPTPSVAPRRAIPRPTGIARALSLLGLVLITIATVQIFRTWTPALAESAVSTASPTAIPVGKTATPTSARTIDSEIVVPGILAYVQDGNVWIKTGRTAREVTYLQSGSVASQPAWSPDGAWIYYIDTRIGKGRWYDPANGNAIADYTLTYPVLCRIHPDGTERQDILSSLIKQRTLLTFFWIRQPAVSPDGSTIAVISDGPTVPGVQDTLLHLVPLRTRKLSSALAVPESSPLGLADPAYSPDGRRLAYVMEGRSGKYGSPSIWIYDLAKHSTHKLVTGYRGPSWSPDGKYLAATKVSGDSLDVVVLDAATGKLVSRITTDGLSWAPVWSPAGDALVYAHMRGSQVDLNMVHIAGSGAAMTFRIEVNLTDFSGLDGGSKAAWFIPEYGAPTPTPVPATPSPTTTAGSTPTPVASASAQHS